MYSMYAIRSPRRPLPCSAWLFPLLVLLTLAGGTARAQAVPEEDRPVPAEAAPSTANESESAAGVPEGAAFEGDTVGEIRIVNKSIFDPNEPGEDKLLFRLADRLHRTTRPEVIEQQILLRPGDRFSVAALEESERILRANHYLHEAEIRPIPAGEGRVDLVVETRDVWTLRGGISFNRSGGENATSFNLEDSNFLGTGKEVTLLRVSDVDRTSNLLRYRDPNLGGSRARLELSYAANSDGGRKRLELERPFYSLDTRWAMGFRTMFDDRIERLYDLGEVFQPYRYERDYAEIYTGFSPGRSGDGTHRWRFGLTIDREHFAPDGGLDSDSVIPASRNLSYPWIGYEYVEDGFITESGLDRLQSTVDLNLGRQYHWRLGWSTPDLGADVTRFVFESGMTTGWRPSARQLVLATALGSTRWRSDREENLRLGGRFRYYARNFWNNVFYIGLEAEAVQKADIESQLLLGGDTGLRGYPLRLQAGDRRWLFTVEQRFFSDRELFHLVNLGAAVFFDMGRAWYEDPPPGFAGDQPELRDVGLGLRVGSSRSSKAAMIHLDLAYPLDGDSSKVQWLVRSSETF